MPAEQETLAADPPVSLAGFASALEGKAHLLSIGDEQLARQALSAAKDVFDQALSLESLSHPHLHPFIASISDEPAIETRSSKKNKVAAPPPPDPADVLPYTPLSGLTIDGLDAEQIWQQLELRNQGLIRVVGEIAGEVVDPDDDVGIMDSDSEEDEDDDREGEMTLEEFEEMMADRGESGSEDSEDDDDDDESGESDEEAFDLKGGSDEEGGSLMDGWDEEDEEEVMGSDEEDGDEEEDDEEEHVEDGDSDEEDEGDEMDDDEMTFDDLDGLGGSDEDEDDLPGPSRRKQHPTLDDTFFSIDEFNRMTEETEAGRVSSGRLGGDDDNEEIEDVSQAMLSGVDEDEPLMYGDFFDPPKNLPASAKKPSKKVDKKGKGKAGKVKFAEEEEEAPVDAGRDVMSRVKGDLFDSDDEEEEDEKNLSTHEKQQLALKQQIAELEAQAIGPKDWTLLGEATSRARPENSLLEENLDFEHAGKIVPVITEETVKSLEDLIKKRIIDNNFDSTVRVRAYEPNAFLPSRYLELQDTQSTKSLAQIYEEDYQAQASGTKVKDPRDEKLKREHAEIEKLWDEVCYKLDSLSSLNFVPKQPKAQITTIDNLPTTSLETALPTTSTASTMLAPEELFAPPKASSLVARSELTPEEKQKQRGKARKGKAAQQKALGDLAQLYGKRKSVKEQKDEALKGLVKSGKGVTVVGKGGKEVEKARKRQADADATLQDGKRLKL